MKSLSFLVALLTLFSTALAVEIRKQVVVSYPPETPDSVVNQAKQAIIDAGGVITHEYTLIKGFAATAGEKVLDSVQALSQEFVALVEDDQVLSVST